MANYFGIDIGTTYITVFDREKNRVERIRHEGKIRQGLDEIFIGVKDNDYCTFTGKAGRDIVESMGCVPLEEAAAISCLLATSAWFGKDSGKIIDIGASSLTLYTVQDNRVVDIIQNTLCAAGTGLFLEEQAQRLQLDLEICGESMVEEPPVIASRCTVFAKSDLIHHQQEGRSIEEMWAGLCRSLVLSAVNTLFRGQEPKGKIMLMGGVSLNREVLRWFKRLFSRAQWILPHDSEAVAAKGASLAPGQQKKYLDMSPFKRRKTFKRMPPLLLKRSCYTPIITPVIDEFNNEVRIHRELSGIKDVILGLDIGSTSTKLAVLDAEARQPVVDIYGRTAGDPVGAAEKIFASFYGLLGDKEVQVQAFGTTGSGRKLVGHIFGADLIVNEISAHARGTVHFFPGVETIFEIGGQDAKFISLKNGFAADVNMNYVCAAGTGSFVEEQARKLGFSVDEIGDLTAGIAPPVTSDRCTVFMEQDLRTLLKEGFSREEALASVLYSVIQNYLNRVVGNRKVSESQIFFQGATARNRGLVAALENLLHVEVMVSPFCHVMGGIGAALMAQEHCVTLKSQFVGRQALGMEVVSRTEICNLCHNFCRINFISRSHGQEFSWGYQCGRDPEESFHREIPQYSLFRERQREFYINNTIQGKVKGSIPLVHALTDYSYHPLWVGFFHRLGYRVSISGMTDNRVRNYSSEISSADFCFPVKVALGHTIQALNKSNPIFLPYMIAEKKDLKTAHSFFCPYVESCASVVKSTLTRSGLAVERLISPVIDWRRPLREVAEELFQVLKSHLQVKRREVVQALKRAYRDWKHTIQLLEQKGNRVLEEVKNTGEPVFLLVGRPYNLYDRGLNLGIPEKIAAMGYRVIPIDMLSIDTASLAQGNYHNVFWKYGQRIMSVLQLAGQCDNIFPIYFSNFNCGPDSFLLSFAEEELRGKPLLILELDEHDSDGGYLTRIEAFIDVVQAYMKQQKGVSLMANLGESSRTNAPFYQLEHVAGVGDQGGKGIGNEGETLRQGKGKGKGKEFKRSRDGLELQGLRREREVKMPHVFTVGRKVKINGTVWIPPISQRGSRVYAASFRAFGFDCRRMEDEDQEALVLGKKYLRGGECLPMTLTLGNFLKHIRREDPRKRQILFMPTTEGPCRFGQYNLLERVVFHRLGYENVDILSPSSVNSYQGLPDGLRRQLAHATTASDVLYKMLTRVRPYERTRGDAEELFEKGLKQIEGVLERGERPLKVIRDIASRFAAVNISPEKKPLVGIVGEIYVRQNPFGNGNLIEIIEGSGGEAWLAPVHEWILYTAYLQSFAPNSKNLSLLKKGGSLVNHFYIFKTERNYYHAANEILHDRQEPHMKEVVAAGARYLPEAFEGEGILTIGRAVLFAQQGATMVVNAAPFGCMPGTLSSAILLEIKEKFSIPFLSLFYDGDIDVNDKVTALLKTIEIQDRKKQRTPTGYPSISA